MLGMIPSIPLESIGFIGKNIFFTSIVFLYIKTYNLYISLYEKKSINSRGCNRYDEIYNYCKYINYYLYFIR